MKTISTKNARSLRKAADNFTTYLDTLYYEEKKMDELWEKANRVSEIGYKIHSAAMIVELVADRITDNAESGSLWAATEILQQYSEELEELAADIMAVNRQHESTITTLKPKKSKKNKDVEDNDGRC